MKLWYLLWLGKVRSKRKSKQNALKTDRENRIATITTTGTIKTAAMAETIEQMRNPVESEISKLLKG